MIRKFIGLILILLIIYLAIKALVLLPFLTNVVIGKNKSPFQVGTDYVNQINQVYPTYSNVPQYRYANPNDAKYVGKITLEKSLGKLVLTVEGANRGNEKINIWLTNTPQVTNQTEYIDFGPLITDNGMRQYNIDMKGGDISFDVYKYVLLVDSNYHVYASINLQ